MKVIQLAQQDASLRGHHWIGPEHMFAGLISSGGDSSELLAAFNIATEELSAQTPNKQRYLPFTESARAVLDGAQRLADSLNESHITTAHLLSSLMQGETVVSRKLGNDLKSFEQELQARLKTKSADHCADKRHAHVFKTT